MYLDWLDSPTIRNVLQFFSFLLHTSQRQVNHERDYVLEHTDMPDELLKDVEGKDIFGQTQHQV